MCFPLLTSNGLDLHYIFEELNKYLQILQILLVLLPLDIRIQVMIAMDMSLQEVIRQKAKTKV